MGFLEPFCVLVQLVSKKRLAKRLLDLTLASTGRLPAIKANRAHDLVDIVHNPLHQMPGLNT